MFVVLDINDGKKKGGEEGKKMKHCVNRNKE